ncbi:hypothetical protein KCP75_21015 [Salmonella enterica subsp. enterica]|nr:hypothetical protein KCP75_21015 [Salmonella enterica subsp. enterica]
MVEPDDDERLRVQSELGRIRRRVTNWKISKHPRAGGRRVHILLASSSKMRKIMPVTLRWHSLFAMAVCLRCVNANFTPAIPFCIVCTRARSGRWSTVILMNYCSICSETKLNSSG